MISLWRSIVQQPAYSHAHREQSALPLKIGFRHLIPPRPETSQSSTQTPVSTDSLSATEALRAAPLAVRECVAEEIWAMLLSLVKRGHPAHLIFPHRTAVPHAMRPLTKKPRLHDPSSNETSQSRTWNSLPPSRGCTGRNSRRKGIRTHRTPGARRCGNGCLPGVQADIGHRITTSRADTMRLLPTPRQTGTRPADHKQPSVSVVPPSHTEEAGPPRPPPEPPPGVSAAPPRRTTSSGSTSPCQAAAASSRPSTI
ncbi:hypothetical protein TCDM_13278 [Trypanosoma cruzi Dm28c]|uniref:Uncharacterized protein n=1 Tax=Trypanosoma cruzi Dm28c TaxID=1416333 RepID=V5ANP2_TRYCR|nr:hypothetical protein TCDM_13278 [Trypanosoma cruzi Dm28c]